MAVTERGVRHFMALQFLSAETLQVFRPFFMPNGVKLAKSPKLWRRWAMGQAAGAAERTGADAGGAICCVCPLPGSICPDAARAATSATDHRLAGNGGAVIGDDARV